MKELLSGNEAIARGAVEAGVRFAAAYPGTPSTEILETLATCDGIEAQWSPNEKTALEAGIGACLAGARVLVAMKHVGLNVAADPLMTLSYTGVNGGLVIVTADDPGMHSSQNEQDNRHYARFAKVPMLEPSDSQEAKDFVLEAFKISEQFDTPVLVRTTTRVSHGKSLVKLGTPVTPDRRLAFERNPRKYVMIPAHARVRHAFVEQRLEKLRKLSERTSLNRIETGSRALGIVASSIAYEHAKEVAPDASFLKLGLSYPLPIEKLRAFAKTVRKLVVIEELDPFTEEQLRAAGLKVVGKPAEYRLGELTPDRVAEIVSGKKMPCAKAKPADVLPPRPPVLCPSCPHRAVFHVIRKLKLVATGDIGCYTLGTLPPLNALDTCICMGASVGAALGMTKVLDEKTRKTVVGVIGDSTFVHSGITGLIDMVYNRGVTTLLILDNRTTAMTGRQDHPATGRTLQGEPTHRLDLAGLCRAVGAADVRTVKPFDLKVLEEAVRSAVAFDGVSVLIVEQPCVLITKERPTEVMHVELELCRKCGACLKLGCPAISELEDGAVAINPALCNLCGLCAQVCPFDAIHSIPRC
ncbi:MAG: indolepyruvate ferredoxin oxidoreductase subunit alpha [Verrucomicrobia bacterium]|nr:indolepyruvate ferredoxin oxidoreductase subunit alpha [Verrucomicrobiota bacterium]